VSGEGADHQDGGEELGGGGCAVFENAAGQSVGDDAQGRVAFGFHEFDAGSEIAK
jgi:hypothetical protein